MITLNAIAKRLEEFGTNHFFIKSYSFGSPDDVDLDKFQDFPLMHVVYTGSDYEERTKTFSFEVYVFDRPNREEQMTVNQREVVSDAQQCLEDVIADIANGGNIFLFDEDYEVTTAGITPLIDERSNLLTGALLDLTIQVPYQRDACNLPIDGVQSAGGEISYRRRGILRIRTQDGTTDVQSVNEIRVTNGTLTDEGDGVVSIDTGGVDILGDLENVNLTDLQDHEALVYDEDTATWINGASTKIGIRVINQTGGPLFAALPVRATGVQGDQVTVERFNAASDDPKTFIGLLDSEIANGETGYARQTGAIYNLNTSYFDIGDILYPTTNLFITNEPNSFLTTSVPDTPGAKIACAIVLRKHANTGRVYVRTWTPSRKLEDLDDVNPLILPQFREGKSLVWNINRWIAGSPKLNMSELLDVQTYNPITIPNKQTLRWSSTELEWQVIPEVGGLPTTPDVITYFLGRYNDEASTAREAADATLTIEHYLSVQADGHGEEITQQTDTPTSGNKIVRKIWHKGVSFEDSDVSTWTLVHTFADDTTYNNTIATFNALLTAATYGSIPFTLAQTWEEVPAFTGLLETYSGAAAAYSLRLLDSTYTGDAIRVRRASDNAEQDIGFSDNELDTSALATFCAGTDGFVKTWYDQSGSGNEGTNLVTSRQPKIYDASTGVVLKNGNPAIYFDGDDLFDLSEFITPATNSTYTASIVANADSDDKTILILSDGAENMTLHYGRTAGQLSAGVFDGSSVDYASGAATITNQFISFSIHDFDAVSVLLFINGNIASGTELGRGDFDSRIAGGPGGRSLIGQIQEIVLWPSDQSANRTAIEANINTAFSIYGQSPTGFLADYPGAAAAYSLRQLISTATYAVAVRRDSDDAVLPIGFVDGELDTDTLAAFCSGANGFVAVWYDQSGEGNHATQATAASQPKIYDASTGVTLEGGQPIVEGGAAKWLVLPLSTTGSYKVYEAGKVVPVFFSVLFGGTNGSDYVLIAQDGNSSTTLNANSTINALRKDGATFAPTTRNDVYDALALRHLVYVDVDLAYLGTEVRTNYSSPGGTGMYNLHELIVYPDTSTHTPSAIESNINDFYTIY